MRRRRALARLIAASALISPACSLRLDEPLRARSGPVVVVGTAPPGEGSDEVARARAEDVLLWRLRDELKRREASARWRPGERVRNWVATESALAASARSLLDGWGGRVEILPSGEALVAGRIGERAFDAAVEEARAAGRRAPLRIAVLPLAVPGKGTREIYAFREVYASALREALEGEGAVLAGTSDVYATLEKLGVSVERRLSGEEAALACRALACDAVVTGSARAEREGVALEVELRDARGRLIGTIDSETASLDEARAVARRQALVLRAALFGEVSTTPQRD